LAIFNIIEIVLENQLFAPALKGVIDFDCVELARRGVLGSSHPLGLGANEENQ
jgi:hypothetical protein